MKKINNKSLYFWNLKEVKKNKPLIFKSVMKWIEGLTEKFDFENGKKFVKLVEGGLKRRKPFGVFVLFDDNIDNAVGIVSVAPDDQDVEKENKLKGVWIAGFNIKREYRGMGYGMAFFKKLDDYFMSLNRKKFIVNLFANNPIALKIYKKFDFKNTGIKIYRKGEENEVYTKIYRN